MRPELVKRIVIYGLLIFFLSVAMSSFFANLHHLPATPDLMLGAVLAVAVIDDRKVAAIVAVVGGVTADALGGVGASLSPLLYLSVILTVGILSEKMLPRFLSWLILLLPSLLLRALFTLAGFWLYTGGGSFSGIVSGEKSPLMSISSSKVPSSAIVPSFSTMILSQSLTVESLCATINTVQFSS